MTAASNMRLLMWVYARSFINGLTHGSGKERFKNIGVLASRLFAFVAFYFFFRYLMFGGAAMTGADEREISAITSSMIHALGAFLLLGAIKFAYQVFYLSPDLEWLLSSPIPTSRIFIAKFIENWIYSGQIVFSFGWPIVIAYGAYSGASLAYYPIVILATAILAVYSGAIGVLICLPFMRYVTANRLRELLLTLSMGLSIGLYIIFRNAGLTTQGNVTEFQPWWLPTTHLGNIIESSINGEWATALLSCVVFLIPAILLAGIAYVVSLRLYLSGLQRKGEADERIRAREGEGFMYRLARLLPTDIRAMAIKDALTTIRSPRQWFYLIFAIVFIGFQFMSGESHGPGAVHLFLLLFIVSIFSQELTVLSISRESDSFPLVAVSGIPSWRVYAAKWITAFIPTIIFALTVAIVGGILREQTFINTIIDMLIVLIGVVPLISYSLMIGCLFPDFKAYRSRRRVSPWVLFMNMFFTMLLITLIIFPLYLVRSPLSDGGYPLWLNIALIAFAITISILITAISFAAGSTRLRRFLSNVPVG